ncbi:MAG: YciI family protein [Rhodanobacteraceae bacterium]|nr:YciI family protein [Rhodanobacteraceae bacterium]
MKYILLIYGDPAAEAQLSEAQMQAIYQAHAAYGQALEAAGVIRGGAELKPPATATTLRFSGGRSTLVDGPYAETKEQLGGYYLIETDTLDEALAWAAKMPGMEAGAVEVRPLGMGA